ncbi:MAG: type II toxin-antitoxin system RelE/ParE family toxin [Nostoc sp. LLA-1]|nr:type II toxin-antitoxin system RelE/ParE family toxin [Cyanocohniella sp. LLY]
MYTIWILPNAYENFNNLPPPARIYIEEVILSLATIPIPSNAQQILDTDGWYITVDSYHIIYEVQHTSRTILILDIIRRVN